MTHLSCVESVIDTVLIHVVRLRNLRLSTYQLWLKCASFNLCNSFDLSLNVKPLLFFLLTKHHKIDAFLEWYSYIFVGVFTIDFTFVLIVLLLQK